IQPLTGCVQLIEVLLAPLPLTLSPPAALPPQCCCHAVQLRLTGQLAEVTAAAGRWGVSLPRDQADKESCLAV
ncbi:hypothetical protein HaLaN_30151, partial [Haematococcus lacustris]